MSIFTLMFLTLSAIYASWKLRLIRLMPLLRFMF
jgi:hypothetical protein